MEALAALKFGFLETWSRDSFGRQSTKIRIQESL
jgi:hypothetical protein